ncbi:conserved hypothetical protein [Burkholderia ambifaria MEX-5]|uniref:Uncharacterized protein n=2 Tax=Burkholderia ambifaria TaxID=152480 RepID=B1T1L2_9BURK|nr:hypothetical protein [Burkholderia ambifaria]EDT42519.1 conserved hypothetical protein [Burkholderia ambifaria MEX-5]
MRKLILLTFLQTTFALSGALPFMSIRADESVMPAHTALLADSASSIQRDNSFGIVPVAVPQPNSADKASVTLWDEIVPRSPLPMPIPAPRPGHVQHAMAGHARNGTVQ